MIAQTRSTRNALAARIRNRRQSAGWSLRDMAEASGLSFATLQRVESGRDSRISTLETIADFFGLSLVGLLGDQS